LAAQEEERRRGRFLPRQASLLLLLRRLRKRIDRGLATPRRAATPDTPTLSLSTELHGKRFFAELRVDGVLRSSLSA
jgi:hypothetical protein